jgi:hypothetical protein
VSRLGGNRGETRELHAVVLLNFGRGGRCTCHRAWDHGDVVLVPTFYVQVGDVEGHWFGIGVGQLDNAGRVGRDDVEGFAGGTVNDPVVGDQPQPVVNLNAP